jgi:hypothetical protein
MGFWTCVYCHTLLEATISRYVPLIRVYVETIGLEWNSRLVLK